ncbi:MAG: phosphoribosyl-AMP cyclohydrolase [Candidatus Thorarchaeota archaeon]
MIRIEIEDLDFKKGNGLIPVVVQSNDSGEILTLAYVNRKALDKTLETGYAHYFRRSHGRVMKKGVTSGNVQEVKRILADCDNDSIVYIVDQTGVACHLGKESCFHKEIEM